MFFVRGLLRVALSNGATSLGAHKNNGLRLSNSTSYRIDIHGLTTTGSLQAEGHADGMLPVQLLISDDPKNYAPKIV